MLPAVLTSRQARLHSITWGQLTKSKDQADTSACRPRPNPTTSHKRIKIRN